MADGDVGAIMQIRIHMRGNGLGSSFLLLGLCQEPGASYIMFSLERGVWVFEEQCIDNQIPTRVPIGSCVRNDQL